MVITAIAFDFTNGFHDTANAMATSIATGALRPFTAVAISAALNLVGAFLSVNVAATVAKGIVNLDSYDLSGAGTGAVPAGGQALLMVVFTGLIVVRSRMNPVYASNVNKDWDKGAESVDFSMARVKEPVPAPPRPLSRSPHPIPLARRKVAKRHDRYLDFPVHPSRRRSRPPLRRRHPPPVFARHALHDRRSHPQRRWRRGG